MWSLTKSIFGLCVVYEIVHHGFDVLADVSEYIRTLCPDAVIDADAVSLADIMTHTTGISPVPLASLGDILDFFAARQSTHSKLARYVKYISRARRFQYSPILGFMLAGAIFELQMRKKTGNHRFSLQKRCEELFFPASIKGQWQWSVCDGLELCNHTMAYSELQMTGAAMQRLLCNVAQKHSDLFAFLLTPREDGTYVRHARSVSASGGEQSGTRGGDAEVLIDYDYSLGWWIIPADQIVTGIGLGGQYMTFDTVRGTVGVRQQCNILLRNRTTFVESELLYKKESMLLNSHETFPLLVRDIARTGNVDFQLEWKHMFSPADFQMYWRLADFIDLKSVSVLSDVALKILCESMEACAANPRFSFCTAFQKKCMLQAAVIATMIKTKSRMNQSK